MIRILGGNLRHLHKQKGQYGDLAVPTHIVNQLKGVAKDLKPYLEKQGWWPPEEEKPKKPRGINYGLPNYPANALETAYLLEEDLETTFDQNRWRSFPADKWVALRRNPLWSNLVEPWLRLQGIPIPVPEPKSKVKQLELPAKLISASREKLEEALSQYRRELRVLREQEACYGLDIPLRISNQISEREGWIQAIEETLAQVPTPARSS